MGVCSWTPRTFFHIHSTFQDRFNVDYILNTFLWCHFDNLPTYTFLPSYFCLLSYRWSYSPFIYCLVSTVFGFGHILALLVVWIQTIPLHTTHHAPHRAHARTLHCTPALHHFFLHCSCLPFVRAYILAHTGRARLPSAFTPVRGRHCRCRAVRHIPPPRRAWADRGRGTHSRLFWVYSRWWWPLR